MRPRVYLIPADNPRWFRWKDRNGRVKQRVCHANNQRAAQRQARELESELAASWGTGRDVSFTEFADRYADQHLATKRVRTGEKWYGVKKRWLEFLESKGLDPDRLAMREIEYSDLLEFEAWIFASGLAPTTVVTDIKAFRAGLNFAARNGWMPILPRGSSVKEPERQLPSPVTPEEFDSMLKAVTRVMIKRLRPHWKAILKAYYLGGFRVTEPIDFRWHGHGFHVPVLDDCDFPYIDWAPRQKNRKCQSVAISDELADVIRELPKINEFVFQTRGPKVRYSGRRQISQVIHDIAESAKVTRETDAGQVYVTAQYLRRSFGQRMSRKVSAVNLKHLMRHSSIATTMKYYLSDDASAAAREMRGSSNVL